LDHTIGNVATITIGLCNAPEPWAMYSLEFGSAELSLSELMGFGQE
jgi:hypothetical protein